MGDDKKPPAGAWRQLALAVAVLALLLSFVSVGYSRRRRAFEAVQRTAQVDELSKELAQVVKGIYTLRDTLEYEKKVEQDLEKIPFSPRQLEVWHRKPPPGLFAGLKPQPPLPKGSTALLLARELGWPDEWEARHRPRVFFLGPPRSGATTLADCARRVMWGNASHRPYPMAQELWPFNFTAASGEPVVGNSPEMENFMMWNRTGFRYFDAPLEWWAYPEAGRYPTTGRGWMQRRRFPPVEEDSKNWVVMDATPDQLMIPVAADAVAADFQQHRDWPVFNVVWRDPVERAFSHFLLFAELRVLWGWGEEPDTHFPNVLEQELQRLNRKEICRRMLYEPEELLTDVIAVQEALQKCMYDPRHRDQVHYLSFGFAALGMAYWTHHFPPSQFRVLRHTDMVKLDAEQTIQFLEATFGFSRMPPRCKQVRGWMNQDGQCTGQYRHDTSLPYCSAESPNLNRGLRKRVLSKQKFTKGTSAELQEFRAIAKAWDAAFAKMIQEKSIPVYNARRQAYEA